MFYLITHTVNVRGLYLGFTQSPSVLCGFRFVEKREDFQDRGMRLRREALKQTTPRLLEDLPELAIVLSPQSLHKV